MNGTNNTTLKNPPKKTPIIAPICSLIARTTTIAKTIANQTTKLK